MLRFNKLTTDGSEIVTETREINLEKHCSVGCSSSQAVPSLYNMIFDLASINCNHAMISYNENEKEVLLKSLLN